MLADCIQRKQFDEGQSLLQEELPDEPAVYVVREGTALVKYVDAEGKAQEKSVGVGEVFGHEHLTSHEDAQMRRPDGYTAVGKDGPVAVGVLPLRDIQRVSQHDDQAGDKAVIATASLRLQQKIREAVKAKISLDAFEKISVLGEGQFGEVWLVAADVFQTGVDSMKQRFALKSQNLDDEIRGSEATEAIRREIDILESLTQNCPHPGIVNLVNTYEDEKSIYMLMGLISGGELWSRIHQEDGEGNWHSGMTECDAKFYTYVVADTLGFMHLQHIVFRDLKPENIMLDDDGYPVIVDFGFAKRVPQGEKTFTFCGTPNYVAPEVILHSGHDKGVDYWALGITMYEMVAGVNPFYYDGLDNVTLYNTICQEQFYAYPKEISPELLDLTHELLDKNAGTRLGSLAGGVNDILSHGWFAGFDLQRYRSKEIEAPWKPHVDTDHVLDEEAMEEVLASFISNVPNQSTSFHSYLKEQAVFYNPLHGFEEIDEEQDVSDTCEFHSYVDGDQDEWSGTEFDAEEEKEEDSEPTKSPMSQPFGLPSSVTRFESESMEEATLNSGLDGSASKRPADPPAICVSVPNEPRKGESRPSLFDSSSKGSLSRSDSGVSLSQSERSTSADNEDLSNINMSRRSSLSRSDSGNSAMNRSERGSLSASGIHRPRMSWRQKEKSKMARRSTIQGALADLGLDDDPMDDFKNP